MGTVDVGCVVDAGDIGRGVEVGCVGTGVVGIDGSVMIATGRSGVEVVAGMTDVSMGVALGNGLAAGPCLFMPR